MELVHAVHPHWKSTLEFHTTSEEGCQCTAHIFFVISCGFCNIHCIIQVQYAIFVCAVHDTWHTGHMKSSASISNSIVHQFYVYVHIIFVCCPQYVTFTARSFFALLANIPVYHILIFEYGFYNLQRSIGMLARYSFIESMHYACCVCRVLSSYTRHINRPYCFTCVLSLNIIRGVQFTYATTLVSNNILHHSAAGTGTPVMEYVSFTALT
jgi:hypothetical protein